VISNHKSRTFCRRKFTHAADSARLNIVNVEGPRQRRAPERFQPSSPVAAAMPDEDAGEHSMYILEPEVS
jgi:hypothetical protein